MQEGMILHSPGRGKAEARLGKQKTGLPEGGLEGPQGEWGAACLLPWGVSPASQGCLLTSSIPITLQSTRVGDNLGTLPQGLCPEQPSPKQTPGASLFTPSPLVHPQARLQNGSLTLTQRAGGVRQGTAWEASCRLESSHPGNLPGGGGPHRQPRASAGWQGPT